MELESYEVTFTPEYRKEETAEFAIDQRRRIVHIFSYSFAPDIDDSGRPYFSIELDKYLNRVFDEGGFYKGLNNHTDELKELFMRLDHMRYSMTEKALEPIEDQMRYVKLLAWQSSWSWCFYGTGYAVYILEKGKNYTLQAVKLAQEPGYLVDMLHQPFANRSIEAQIQYRRK